MRIQELDWAAIAADLDRRGFAVRPLLDAAECASMRDLWDDEAGFRKRVVMERHGYGQGSYKYWCYPLPPLVAALRPALYAGLAPVAETWRQRLNGSAEAYPPDHETYLARCHAAGQAQPTPLLLQYHEGGYNCLHRDLYGPLVFPMQSTILLSRPGEDFEGGEFVLVEQRPRAQSAAEVVPLRQGDMVIFAVEKRPVMGKRGWHGVTMRHGVSRVRSGERYTLGVILHDADS